MFVCHLSMCVCRNEKWDFTVCIFFTFLAAALTYVLIEKPFMSLRPTVNFTPKQRDQKERMSETPALQCV